MKKIQVIIKAVLFLFYTCISLLSFSQLPKIPVKKPPRSVPLIQRPNSPIDLRVTKRGVDFLTIRFSDSSRNELGNRIYRSTDGVSWTLIKELGVIEWADQFEYTDINLENTKLYYYKVEVYANAVPISRSRPIVSSFTPALKAYTGEGDSVKLFRLQVAIRTSDMVNADLDAPLRVDIGLNRGTSFPASFYTFLDYGHDDFEKGSDFSYDVVLGGVNSLAELGDIIISNTSFDDRHIIGSIKIIANNNLVFERSFPGFGHTLHGLGTIRFPFNELAKTESWHQLVVKQRNLTKPPAGLDFFLLSQTPQMWAVKIPKSEIISKIESILGHSLNAEPSLGDNIYWREGPDAVAVSYKSIDTLNVALRLKTIKLIDRNLNASLDLAISSSCSNTGLLTLTITPCNLTSNHDLDFLNGLTPGINLVLKIAYDLAGRSQNQSGTINSIVTTAQIPKCFDFNMIKCVFTREGDLLILLGAIGNCND